MKRLRFAAVLVAAFARHRLARRHYPNKPVHVLLGFPVGQATDVLARVVAAKLSEQHGQQFYVENRPGAAGIIATELAAKARARRLHAARELERPARGQPRALPKLP